MDDVKLDKCKHCGGAAVVEGFAGGCWAHGLGVCRWIKCSKCGISTPTDDDRFEPRIDIVSIWQSSAPILPPADVVSEKEAVEEALNDKPTE